MRSAARFAVRMRAEVAPAYGSVVRPSGPVDAACALPAMQLPRLVERLGRAAREVQVGTPPILGELGL